MNRLIVLLSMSMLLNVQSEAVPQVNEFDYTVDQFADIQILRYRVPGFEQLSLKQKEMIYYLSQAAIEGRDIFYDQNHKNNLLVRRTLEAVYENFSGNRESDEFKKFTLYLKQVWMGNGIHHHYSGEKFIPTFSKSFLREELRKIEVVNLPIKSSANKDEYIDKVCSIIFDKTLFPKRSIQTEGVDLILHSSNNYYEGVNQKEVEEFYATMKNPSDQTPVSYGLNSKLVKEKGVIKEQVYRVGGMYGDALERVVGWLRKAAMVAENPAQRAYIETLIEFNITGDLKTFDQYAVQWVQELDAQIDFINGFTETYGDPLGMKASWESLINFKNIEATRRTQIISDNAQWFEDHSPVDKSFKKKTVKGVSAKVITAAMLGGDCYPATPIGVNLPNSNWIRRDFGSKSVTIENITEAYDQVSFNSGFSEEFIWSTVELERAKKYGSLTNNLHTDMHECLGHGSGKLLPGVDPDGLKAYGSVIEEARADLFGLYYMGDAKMLELGLLPDGDAYKAAYYQYLMNGLLTQLTRVELGKTIEQAHMRNRQLIASWVLEKATKDACVELKMKDEKWFVVVNDYAKLRVLFGELLQEIQRIKSTGDFEAAKNIVETYGIKVNQPVHANVLERFKKLNLAPYRGFINPVYTLHTDSEGKVLDVTISYDEDFVQQNLRYSREYSRLPNVN